MSSTYSDCIAQKKYEYVLPGEVCSIETAKKLGIFDKGQFYAAGYQDVKTYQPDKDKQENRGNEICTQNREQSAGYATCVMEHGVGFTRKFGSPDKCVTYACPPGFKAEGMKCKKPLEDAIVSKRSRCDERWYDWFMIPNYHLGNRVQKGEGVCYAPCPEGTVPGFNTDPVDRSTSGNDDKSTVTKCFSKEDYMHGKYEDTSEFCPLAWIHRVGALPSVFRSKMEAQLQEEKAKGMPTEHMNTLDTTTEAQAAFVAQEATRVMENVEVAEGEMVRACNELHTEDRLIEAYELCDKVQNTPDALRTLMAQEMNDTETMLDQKMHVLRQACSAVFCNADTDAAGVLNREPLCFPEEGTMEIEMKDDAADTRKGPDPTQGNKRVRKALSLMIKLVVFPMLFVMGFLLAAFILKKLKEWLTGWKKSENAEAIRAMSMRLGKK